MGEKKYGKKRKGNINSNRRNEDGKDMVKRGIKEINMKVGMGQRLSKGGWAGKGI